jgi:hypothetical protein
MKKILILGMAVFLVFGVASVVSAVPAPLASAEYFVVNGNSDSSTAKSIEIQYFNVLNATSLEYSTNSGSTWESAGGMTGSFFVGDVENKKLVKFRVGNGIGGYYDTATLLFYGHSKDPNTIRDDKSLFRSVSVSFINGVSFNTAEFNHFVSPVPLPGAVWLLGAGLIGLVGVRRKIRG